jgi:signal transduction histidine kinase/ligand-binding sensor domain-containing protein
MWRMKQVAAAAAVTLLAASTAAALDPSLEVSQYAHTSWTVRGGFSLGAVFAMAQTADGYLWLGSEYGLFRFDGVSFVPWQPREGEQLPARNISSLLAARDGTLWIGTFAGLASWHDGRLTRFDGLERVFVTSLLEDRRGTVWVGGMSDQGGHLCALRGGRSTCSGGDGMSGMFGRFVWSFHQDKAGTLWVASDAGLWRWAPGEPKRYPLPGAQIGDLTETDDGRLVIGIRDRALRQLIDDRIEPYPIRRGGRSTVPLQDTEVDSNKLLRDRDGGLWIATARRGLIRAFRGRADTFAVSDGLAGNVSCSLFEDREGTIWVATTGGLDRFQQSSVATVSTKQGLHTDAVVSVLGATDGSMWLAAREGLMRWKDGQFTTFRTTSGLPDDATQSLYEDSRGRVWVFTNQGLAYFDGKRFVPVSGVPSKEVFSITGDEAGNLWLSGDAGLTHLRAGRVVEDIPWTTIGQTRAKVVVSDKGGVWLSFWTDGGVMYFKDGQVRASYSTRDGLGKGHVPGLALDNDGAVWASTEEGGLSRIKDGHVATLTSSNGLPCDAIHGTVQDDRRSLWVYAACGVLRITRPELDAWIARPQHRVQTTLWDAADGAKLRALAPTSYEPLISRSTDGKLWFVAGEGVQVLDPQRLASNSLRPPVYVERLTADNTVRWQHLPGGTMTANLRLPPRVRDVAIDYTALSLVAPEKNRFRYRLEGQDHAWREVVNDRRVQYSNLGPGAYRFRVIASNNSGVWNEQGATLAFSVDPAYYQTNWFRALCVGGGLIVLWAGYQLRVRQLHHEFQMALDARVHERTRVARDLHDTLLQSFQSLLLRFQVVSELLADHPAIRARQDAAIAQVAQAIAEGRDAVQGLRDSTLERNDLARAISVLGARLTADSVHESPPVLRISVEGTSRDLRPILRDEIYKIAAEALRNAFRYAQAARVDVDIQYGSDRFRLRVKDGGRGIDPAVLEAQGASGHYGLAGMRERATVIGGTLTLTSAIGAGTEVQLVIPAAIAYHRPPNRSWFSWPPHRRSSEAHSTGSGANDRGTAV